MKRLVVYKANDGKEFDNGMDCMRWDNQLEIEDKLKALLGTYASTGRAESVARGLILKATEVRDLLTIHIRRQQQKTARQEVPGKPSLQKQVEMANNR